MAAYAFLPLAFPTILSSAISIWAAVIFRGLKFWQRFSLLSSSSSSSDTAHNLAVEYYRTFFDITFIYSYMDTVSQNYRHPLLQTRLVQFEVHGFQRNIVHCTILTLLNVESKCTRWKSTMLMSCASVSRVQTACDELDQCIIDNAIKQWRARLRACVKANCGHFEHKL